LRTKCLQMKLSRLWSFATLFKTHLPCKSDLTGKARARTVRWGLRRAPRWIRIEAGFLGRIAEVLLNVSKALSRSSKIYPVHPFVWSLASYNLISFLVLVLGAILWPLSPLLLLYWFLCCCPSRCQCHCHYWMRDPIPE
jgi:hypothetical protein